MLQVLFEVEVISFIQANPYDEYELAPEEARKKLTVTQMLIICNCLREVADHHFDLNIQFTGNHKFSSFLHSLATTTTSE